MAKEVATHIDPEIRLAIIRVEKVNQKLAKISASDETRLEVEEDVCVETRAAYAKFANVSYWSGEIDKDAKKELLDVLQTSRRLLEPTKEVDDKFYKAVVDRIDELNAFTLVKRSAGI